MGAKRGGLGLGVCGWGGGSEDGGSDFEAA